MGRQGGEVVQQGSGWRIGQARQRLAEQMVPHLCADKLRVTTKSETDRATQGSSMEKESLKISDCKNLWVLWWQERLRASQESLLERPTGSWNLYKPTHLRIVTRRAQFASG